MKRKPKYAKIILYAMNGRIIESYSSSCLFYNQEGMFNSIKSIKEFVRQLDILSGMNKVKCRVYKSINTHSLECTHYINIVIQ